MKCSVAIRVCIAIIMIFSIATVSSAQTGIKYNVGRIVLSDGSEVKGRHMNVDTDQVSILVTGQTMTYKTDDIVRVEAKKGWAAGWAAGCGCGCFAFLLVGNFANSDNPLSGGQIVLGSVFWGLVSGGVSGLVAHLADPYREVHINRNHSQLDQLELNFNFSNENTLGANLTFNIPSY